MAKKKDAQEESGDGLLASAAKTIGKAAGTIAALGVTPKTQSSKVPKLAKKNKNHLPRRVKKAQRKAADRL